MRHVNHLFFTNAFQTFYFDLFTDIMLQVFIMSDKQYKPVLIFLWQARRQRRPFDRHHAPYFVHDLYNTPPQTTYSYVMYVNKTFAQFKIFS